MPFRSLGSSMLLALAGLVLVSCLLLAVLVSQRYVASLRSGLQAGAENLAHRLASQAADMILINDLVSLQKLLALEQNSHPEVVYVFVLHEGKVLAGTFVEGVPEGLVNANTPPALDRTSALFIHSTTGEEYLDIAWPIFEGKAGVLRMGFSESELFAKVRALWREVALLTGAILAAALLVGVFFTRRITRPLGELLRATSEIDYGNFSSRVTVSGNDELAVLGDSFNRMSQRLQIYISRIEEQAADIERLYSQLSMAYEVIHGVSTLRGLHDMGAYIMGKVQERITCSKMALYVFDSTRCNLFIVTPDECSRRYSRELAAELEVTLDGLRPFAVAFDRKLPAPLVPEYGATAPRHGIIPLHCERRLCGCLTIFCPDHCGCGLLDADFVGMILAHTTASLIRAALHEEEIRRLTSRLDNAPEFCGIVGRDASMQVVFKLIEDVAPTDATVLIQGESGTGKELVAKAIHEQSARRDKPFVVINCSAYPETLLESELFGHEKGSFTGAVKHRVGRFEQADGGTVFLDEIGEVPPQAQVKLLRVLQTRQLERLGSDKTIPVDVRIIAATNKDLLREVRAGAFREDLFYRLDVVSINLPPLRERGNDVALLAQHFLRLYAAEQGKAVTGPSPKAMRLLLDYDWPGNVRELENVMEQSVVVARTSTIHHDELPAKLQQGAPQQSSTMHEHERSLLLQTLEECNWNKTHAAERLGIGRSTLYAKLRKLRIQQP
jgi:transcriptional regulator with GAF, ATPase, and Fis domain